VTRRATARGDARTSLDGTQADVLVCGASFAGLAVARELAGSGASVLLVDRYDVGERATSACAAPTPWLHAMGVQGAIRSELPCMRFTTPHGTVRCRLPWTWSAFDYRELCRLLYEQADARFETALVQGRADGGVATDRGVLRAPLIVDALGWRRVLDAGGVYQPPDAPLSRGLEVHPPAAAESDELHVWVERDLVRRGYGWSVPAGREVRVGVGSYEPRRHVREPTVRLAEREGHDPVRYQGNWFPHRLRPATGAGVFFVGDAAGHCLPLSGEGIRTAFYFGVACGRELRAVVEGRSTHDEALARYGAFSQGHARPYRVALALQRLVPALPPRVLTAVLRLVGRRRVGDRAFGWYLEQAHPRFASAAERGRPTLSACRSRSPSPARSSSSTAAPAAASSDRISRQG
jgi:menaquinone-9 beta-reductase